MKIIHIVLAVCILMIIPGVLAWPFDLPFGSAVPYEEGWEAKSGLKAVSVATKGTAWMDGPIPTGWQQIGSRGYSGFYGDPDGNYKPSHGYPNIEVEVGGAVSNWFLGTSKGWFKENIEKDRTVVVNEDGSEEGHEYSVDRYTFFVRISVTGDIKHVHTWAGANDRFETETSYDRGGSRLVGTPAEITVYPYFKIDPWDIRDGHDVGAWIMKANLLEVWAYQDEVDNELEDYIGGKSGIAQMHTATGRLNMFSQVHGVSLEQLEYQRGITPDRAHRSAVFLQLNARMLPGHGWKTMYADKGELKQIPRDIVCKIAVEVLRTDNWEIESSRQDENKTRPLRDLEEGFWQVLQWDQLSGSQKMLLIAGVIILILIIVGPYLGMAAVGAGNIMSMINAGRKLR